MLKINKYSYETQNIQCKPTGPWSHRDADTREKTALLLLGEEQCGRRDIRGEEEDEDEEKGGGKKG